MTGKNATGIDTDYRQVSPHAHYSKLRDALSAANEARWKRERARKELLQQLADLDREDQADLSFVLRVADTLNGKREEV